MLRKKPREGTKIFENPDKYGDKFKCNNIYISVCLTNFLSPFIYVVSIHEIKCVRFYIFWSNMIIILVEEDNIDTISLNRFNINTDIR